MPIMANHTTTQTMTRYVPWCTSAGMLMSASSRPAFTLFGSPPLSMCDMHVFLVVRILERHQRAALQLPGAHEQPQPAEADDGRRVHPVNREAHLVVMEHRAHEIGRAHV